MFNFGIMRTRVKICCISSKEEARIAIEHGADALGLVGKMPSGPAPIDDELIAEIAKTISPPLASFLLTSEQTAKGIIEHVNRVHTNTVQIVDELSEGNYIEIRQRLPHLRIVQVIHVQDDDSIDSAVSVSPYVDALLLDSGNPKAAIKTLGGTGNTHNWDVSKEIVRVTGIPVFLAGGLNADNVRDAIEKVNPFGVDVCSGVRSEGKLDPAKLFAFMKSVRV